MHLHPKPNAPLFCEKIYCGSIIFHGVNVRGLSKFCCFVVNVISWIPGLLHYKQGINSLLSEVNSGVNGNTCNPRKLIAHEQWLFHIISTQLHLKDNSFKTSHLNFLFTFEKSWYVGNSLEMQWTYLFLTCTNWFHGKFWNHLMASVTLWRYIC